MNDHAPKTGRPQPTTVDLANALEHSLARTLEEYRTLRRLIGKRRDALRRADATGVTASVEDERHVTTRIAELDRTRLAASHAIARRFGLPTTSTVSELAAKLPPQQAEAVTVVAAILRDEIDACRRDSSVVRAAAEALSQHVTGVVQAVQRAFAGASTYSRGGRLASVVPIRSIDLKS